MCYCAKVFEMSRDGKEEEELTMWDDRRGGQRSPGDEKESLKVQAEKDDKKEWNFGSGKRSRGERGFETDQGASMSKNDTTEDLGSGFKEILESDANPCDRVAAVTELWRQAHGLELTLQSQAQLGNIIMEFVKAGPQGESGIRDKKDMPTGEQSKVYAAVPLVLHEGKWWDADGNEWSTDEHEWDGWFPK